MRICVFACVVGCVFICLCCMCVCVGGGGGGGRSACPVYSIFKMSFKTITYLPFCVCPVCVCACVCPSVCVVFVYLCTWQKHYMIC